MAAHQYRYLAVSREHSRQFDTEQAEAVTSATKHTIQIQRVADADEVHLYCYSEERRDKEEAINTRFADRFEKELQKVTDSLSKPRGTKSGIRFWRESAAFGRKATASVSTMISNCSMM